MCPPQELADLLDAVAKAPLKAEHRDELRDLFNQKLNNDPSLSLAKSDTTKVDFPENYMRQEDWDKLLDSSVDVTSKLLYLATLWASLGLMHPTERSANNIAAVGVPTEAPRGHASGTMAAAEVPMATSAFTHHGWRRWLPL